MKVEPLGISILGKWFTSQSIYILFKYSTHCLFFKSCLPPSHMLNLSICNCYDAVIYHSGAPSERRICHLCCWEYIARSQRSSGVVSANRATLPMVIPHRFKGLAALSHWLRTVLKWHLLCRLLVAQLKIPVRLSCASNFQLPRPAYSLSFRLKALRYEAELFLFPRLPTPLYLLLRETSFI